jgi:hypothetical protein
MFHIILQRYKIMIKNTTPYIGKIRLKFEKYPEYTGKDKLNKIHLNLGFTKLVSRITPKRDTIGWLINPQSKYLIERNTGGMINNYTFGDTIQEKREQQLPNSFLTKNGEYIGDIERGWWYYKNNMKVCEKYPHGVAECYDDAGNLIGYHGYTHRGGQTFKIGDRLFDASYKPKEEDYEEWEWYGWEYKYLELYGKSDELDKKWMRESGIGYVIPYKKRGKKIIETWEETLQAAINMSKDLS